MKKIYKKMVVAMMLLMPAMLMAQSVVDYTISSGRNSEKWKTLTSSATTVSWATGSRDDGLSSTLVLPFSFKLGETSYSNLKINTNGRIYLGTAANYAYYSIPFTSRGTAASDNCIAPFATDLVLYSNTSVSYVKYQTFGSTGSRTFVIEWRCGRYSRSSAVDTINFQLQLEEGTNVVRFVYGNSLSSSGEFNAYQIGMKTTGGDIITVEPDSRTIIRGITTETFDFWPGDNVYMEFTPGSIPNCPSMMLDARTQVYSSNRAKINWQASASSSAPSYTLKITNETTGSVQTFTTNDDNKLVTSLEPSTPYTAEVYPNCDPSKKASVSFATDCMESDFTAIGSDDANPEYNSFVNNYYKYSACQILARASELNMDAQPIKTLSVYYKDSAGVSSSNVMEMTKSDVTIYMGNTSKNAFNASDDAVPFSQMQIVYQGSITLDHLGYNDIELTTPFNYDGSSNLVIAVVDNSNNYDGTFYRGRIAHNSTSFGGFLYYCNDFTPYSSSSTFTVNNSSRPVVAISSCYAPCSAPELSLTGISTTSVNFSWTATSCSGSSYGSYEIEYGPAGFHHSEGTSQIVNGTTATITGLSDGVDYKAYVRVVDGDGNAKSEWSNHIDFSTSTCDVPQNVTIVSEDDNTATVSWTAALNGTGMYEVEYGPKGFSHGSGTTKNVGATNVTLTGLSAGVEYDVYVRTICDGNSHSQWSTVVNIHHVGIDDVAGRNISVYPNPATDQTVITLNGIDGNVEISLVDLNGRVVYAGSLACDSDCQKTIPVSGLAKGVYFIRISGNDVNMVQKLMVK